MTTLRTIVLALLVIGLTGVNTLTVAGDGDISGLAFFDYTYDFTENAANNDGFQLRRVYFTYQQEISKGIKYKFQTDIDYSNSPKNLYLKNAKIDWSSPVGKLTFGLQGMNVFNIQEKTWGYRFIEKSAMDERKFASSADLGIGYSKKTGENLHLSVLITNGTGYKKSENDDNKKISTQFVMGEKKLSKKDGFNVGGVITFEPYELDSVTTKNKTLIGLFGGYAGNGLRVGGEFDRMSDGGTDIAKQIISAYANYSLTGDLDVFFKYDIYDPNTDSENDGENYLIAGVSCTPGKGLVIAPNIRLVSPQEGDSTTLFKLNFLFIF